MVDGSQSVFETVKLGTGCNAERTQVNRVATASKLERLRRARCALIFIGAVARQAGFMAWLAVVYLLHIYSSGRTVVNASSQESGGSQIKVDIQVLLAGGAIVAVVLSWSATHRAAGVAGLADWVCAARALESSIGAFAALAFSSWCALVTAIGVRAAGAPVVALLAGRVAAEKFSLLLEVPGRTLALAGLIVHHLDARTNDALIEVRARVAVGVAVSTEVAVVVHSQRTLDASVVIFREEHKIGLAFRAFVCLLVHVVAVSAVGIVAGD